MPLVPIEVEVALNEDFGSRSRGTERGSPPQVPPRVDTSPFETAPAAAEPRQEPRAEEQPALTAKEEVQIAALPPSRDAAGNVTIPFGVGESRIPDQAYPELRTIARSLLSNPGMRVQVVAFATGDDEGDTSARRTSLSRALAVRSYLIDAGIRSTRIDVRALGDAGDRGPIDRVEVLLSQS